MGYKLVGYDVIGCNEIDPRMNKVYVANHHPRYNFLMDIRELVVKAKAHDVPEELYNLDILDGSPPCSSFSICGERENGWGKEKHFREGQTSQVLDTLFFDFIELAKELQPKVVVAENVKGLMQGDAWKYMRKIYDELDNAGYMVTHRLLNASVMGLPQKRERVFFACLRKDIADDFLYMKDMFTYEPRINLIFDEEPILWKEVCVTGLNDRPLSEQKYNLWTLRQEGDIDLSRCCERNGENPNKFFNSKFIYNHNVPNTIPASDLCIVYDEGRFRNTKEIISCSSWPTDYNFIDQKVDYICGMSVPPIMMAQVASRIYDQWLSKINKG